MTQDLIASEFSLTGRQWDLPSAAPDTVSSADLPDWLASILTNRGLVDKDALAQHLHTPLSDLDDPSSMADIDHAVDRLRKALQNNETIMVYGDYDVDGVCSTALLVQFLRQVGGQVEYYIPDRRGEGYGLNTDAVLALASRAQVLVTTDCGITAHEEIAAAKEAGLDVIVVDHHQVPETLPPALACLNPHRSDCAFPAKDLCAAGVAFMLVGALRRALWQDPPLNKNPKPDIRELLDLVAVATVADMVPLTRANRILVAAGLRVMRTARRPGLNALMQVSDIDPQRIGARDLGFRIGPRINARGRIGRATTGVDLLLTSNSSEAATLAKVLDDANRTRREIEQASVEQALARMADAPTDTMAAIVLYDPAWHPGILGLVASRLVNRFNRPAIIIGEGGKGSARSIQGLDIHKAIGQGAAYLARFGGHKAAAGITIEPDQVEAFQQAFDAAVREQLGPPPYTASLAPDIEIAPESLHLGMVDELERLGPFGQGNPEPLIVAQQVPVLNKRLVGQDHLKLSLGNTGIDAIAFGFGQHLPSLTDRVDVIYRIERNVFRGRENLQIRVEDLRCNEPSSAPQASD